MWQTLSVNFDIFCSIKHTGKWNLLLLFLLLFFCCTTWEISIHEVLDSCTVLVSKQSWYLYYYYYKKNLEWQLCFQRVHNRGPPITLSCSFPIILFHQEFINIIFILHTARDISYILNPDPQNHYIPSSLVIFILHITPS